MIYTKNTIIHTEAIEIGGISMFVIIWSIGSWKSRSFVKFEELEWSENQHRQKWEVRETGKIREINK